MDQYLLKVMIIGKLMGIKMEIMVLRRNLWNIFLMNNLI